MSRPAKARKSQVLAMALTWDGARWPVRLLPAKARSFLGGKPGNLLAPKSAAKLFADDQVREMRICWVPRLKGGPEVLVHPFAAPQGKRIQFRTVRTVRMDDIFGVVYRK